MSALTLKVAAFYAAMGTRPKSDTIATMNPNQLATIAEAEAIALKLEPVGGGVKDTYIPEYEGPWSPPEMGDSKFYHFRFANGAEGFNVGLIRTLMKQCPVSWLNMVATEIGYQVKFAADQKAAGL